MKYQDLVNYQKECKEKVSKIEEVLEIARNTNLEGDVKEDVLDRIEELLEHWALEECGAIEMMERARYNALDILSEGK